MQILGEAYSSARKEGEGGAANEESEYVRVDTKGSRERERARQGQGL